MTKISNQYSLTNILTADLANSRLGINNVSPAYSLDLTGTARVTTSAYFATASGSVGIGTTSPSTKLHVYEALTNASAHLTIQNNRARNAAVYTQTTNGGFYAGTSIGTDTFNYQIYDGVAGAARLTIASTGAATFSGSITAGDIFSTDGTRTNFFGVGTGANVGYLGTTTNHALAFLTNNTEKMRITSAGDVGIGTSSPGYKLQVSGTGYFSGALSSGGGISAAGTLSSAALSTSQVLYAANLTTFNYAGSLALTVPNALNSGSVLADIRMYMIWATGFGDASHAGARIWLMIMNGGGTAYSATELLGRDTDGGTGLSISRSAVNQITISANGYGFIKSVSCMQLITN